jgi:hypothetical protein
MLAVEAHRLCCVLFCLGLLRAEASTAADCYQIPRFIPTCSQQLLAVLGMLAVERTSEYFSSLIFLLN